jgi:hypothetical protein
MLENLFTPSSIASQPENFFGRSVELRLLERCLEKGAVAIHGPIGIGKSSLLSMIRLRMEGYESDHNSTTIVATGYKDISCVDDAARLLLQQFVDVDETSDKVRLNVGKVVEIESSQIRRNFVAGRHLDCLTKILEKSYLDMMLSNGEYLILAVDEADKCPVALAQLMRALENHVQQAGVENVRFLFAGVSPFVTQMCTEDPGITRFLYKTLSLLPMSDDEAMTLLKAKLVKATEGVRYKGVPYEVDPDVLTRVVALSGNHPHILQLLGSQLIDHENDDPNGVIDAEDLVGSLGTICYESRAHVYDATIHLLQMDNKLDDFRSLLDCAGDGFPTRIPMDAARRSIDTSSLEWLREHNFIAVRNGNTYRLVDEFLRIRLIMDEEGSNAEAVEEDLLLGSDYSRFADVGGRQMLASDDAYPSQLDEIENWADPDEIDEEDE